MTVIFLGSRNFTLINSEYFDSGDVVIAMALQNQPKSVKLTMKKNGSTVFTKGRAALKWNVSENPSKYSIKAFCDSEDEIKESNEENNIGVSKKN